MDIRVIKYFLDVASGETFSKVSARHGISTSTLSKAIKSMETELGITLLKPSGRRVVLTKDGKIFARRISPVYEQFCAAVLETKRGETEDELHIVASPKLSFYGVNEMIVAFESIYGISVKTENEKRYAIKERIHRGEWDFAMLHLEENDFSFVKYPVFDDEIVALCPQTNELSQRESLSIQDVLLQAEAGEKIVFDSHLSNLLVEQMPEVVFPCDKTVGYIDLVEKTMVSGGVVIMFRSNYETLILDINKVVVAPVVGLPHYQFCLAHTKSATLSDSAKCFLNGYKEIYNSVISNTKL